QFAEPALAGAEEVLSLEARVVAEDAAGRSRHEAEDAVHGLALAGAGLAHHGEGLAPAKIEGDPVHRLGEAAVGRIVHVEVSHLEQDVRAHVRILGSRASRRPSPRKFSAKRVTVSRRPGKSSMWGKRVMALAPSETRRRQEAMGGCTPRPR